MSNWKNFVPWVRAKLLKRDGTELGEATFEYRDEYNPDRMRFYRMSDSEFLMIQLALTTISLLYGPNPVCTTSYDGKHWGIVGDDFIEFLELLKTCREEDGTFFKLEEMIHLFQDEIENLKNKKLDLKSKSRSHAGKAKFYWQEACQNMLERLEDLREDLDEGGY